MALSIPLLRGADEVMSKVLVIGGGIAGGAAALQLAQNGVPVRVLERETGPHHKVCGEFLSVEAQRDLARIGFDTVRLGAVPIDRVRLISGRTRIDAALPFTALGISRMRLDEALLEKAGRAGARIEHGVKVTHIGDGAVESSAGSFRAAHLLLATGKHDVRGTRRGEGDDDAHVGFKMHWRIGLRQRHEMARAIELVLFDGGYAGLQLVANDVLNLCLIVRRSRLHDAGGHWDGLLGELMREQHIARRLGDAEPLFARPLSIANLPYGYVCGPEAQTPKGCFRLGDQGALTAPLTGDGMAIAVRSARIAAACVVDGTGPADYHRRLRQAVAAQVRRAMLLQRLGESPLVLPLAFGALRLWPGLLGRVAQATRLGNGSAA